MNSLEKMIMQEIETLEDMRLFDVLGFIRYLKMEKPAKPKGIEKWFEEATQTVRERAEELGVTPEQIQSQIEKIK
ncbi:MAG: hypothetical protein JNM46_02365 [Anaerolineales bacterium]|nr:hypothetical protein [Anaerolineales bacterium]